MEPALVYHRNAPRTRLIAGLDRRTLLGMAGVASISIAAGTLPAYAQESSDRDGEARETTGRGNERDQPTEVPSSSDGAAGVALLKRFMEGTEPKSVISDPGWMFTISQIGNYAFYLPSTWRYEERTDPTPANFNDGFVTTTTLSSPEADAFFSIHDVGLLPFVMTMDEYLQDQIRFMAGNEPAEVFVEEYYSLVAPNDASFLAARIGPSVVTMQSYGSVLNTPGLATSSYGSTIQVTSAAQFDDITERYFFPILSTYQRFSGGSGDSTPSPSPTP
jgi:hypothetical protein